MKSTCCLWQGIYAEHRAMAVSVFLLSLSICSFFLYKCKNRISRNKFLGDLGSRWALASLLGWKPHSRWKIRFLVWFWRLWVPGLLRKRTTGCKNLPWVLEWIPLGKVSCGKGWRCSKNVCLEVGLSVPWVRSGSSNSPVPWPQKIYHLREGPHPFTHIPSFELSWILLQLVGNWEKKKSHIPNYQKEETSQQ